MGTAGEPQLFDPRRPHGLKLEPEIVKERLRLRAQEFAADLMMLLTLAFEQEHALAVAGELQRKRSTRESTSNRDGMMAIHGADRGTSRANNQGPARGGP